MVKNRKIITVASVVLTFGAALAAPCAVADPNPAEPGPVTVAPAAPEPSWIPGSGPYGPPYYPTFGPDNPWNPTHN